jgi:hypothetical protein
MEIGLPPALAPPFYRAQGAVGASARAQEVTRPPVSRGGSSGLLADPTARFHDLGADYHASRIDRDRKTRNLVHQL